MLKRRSTCDAGPLRPIDGLVLGWETETTPRRTIGFHQHTPDLLVPPSRRPIVSFGDQHWAAVASTGSGKFVSIVGPLLATYRGPVILLDVDGAGYHCFSRRRREMGQAVRLLDLFHTISDTPDSINPFDLLDLPGAHADAECEHFAHLLSEGHGNISDPYWSDTGRGLTAGTAGIVARRPKPERTFSNLRKLLHSDDVDYEIAAIVDADKTLNGVIRDELVSYLTAPSDRTRPCILSTAQTFLKALGSETVAQSLDSSTFSLSSILNGDPQSIFIVVPPDKLDSHRAVVRLLLHVFLSTIARRSVIPRERTLLIIDEAAALGALPALKQAITLLRKAGLLVVTLWQDVSQIRQNYPLDFETILNNCDLQGFGFRNYRAAAQWADLVGCSAAAAAELNSDEQILHLAGRGVVRARKLNYLRDPEFAGLADDNPRYRNVNLQPTRA